METFIKQITQIIRFTTRNERENSSTRYSSKNQLLQARVALPVDFHMMVTIAKKM